jgi:hypothetical protein
MAASRKSQGGDLDGLDDERWEAGDGISDGKSLELSPQTILLGAEDRRN